MPHRPSRTHPVYTPVNTLSLGYIKQNAGAEATWRPVNSVNIGGAYGYEHYDWTRAEASSTAENSGKVYADWKPTSWITARASALFSERRAGELQLSRHMSALSSGRWHVPAQFHRVSQFDPVLASIGNSTSMIATAPRASSPSTSRC